ncbi:PA2817 family protein [Parahaliea mediterranea]|uniref:PA2817 family protein n=1 Tax=Parahaliea mediterranea TaxID=651086 RepID=UPI000E2EFBCB|nr:PA2817 family protein [Parahaliea mediterranea]
MNDEQYLQHSLEAWRQFADTFVKRCASLPEGDPLAELAAACQRAGATSDALYQAGPELVARLFTGFPEFAPTVPRELLWFLGGECLHYLTDEEIAAYQEIDEARTAAASRGEVIDLAAARAKLLPSH